MGAVAILGTLTGCVAATATMVGVPVAGQMIARESVKRQTRTDAIRPQARPMLDPGTKWSRRWEGPEGKPLVPSATGDLPAGVRVVWTLPFGVEPGVGAVALVEHPSCASDVVASVRAAAIGEPQQQSRVLGFAPASPTPPLGVAGFVGDAQRLRLVGDDAMRLGSPRWVITTPVPGPYLFEQTWTGASVAELEQRRPCVMAWRGIATAMWDSTSVVASSTLPRRTGTGQTGAATGPLASAGAASRPPGDGGASGIGGLPGGGADTPTGAPGNIELSGRRDPVALGQQLMEIYERALEVSVGSRPENGAEIHADRQARQRLLSLVLADDGVASEVCRLTRRYQMDHRALPYWLDAPTVPPQVLQGRCSAAGAWLPAPRTTRRTVGQDPR